jgi:uncharacterized protein involved in outer membrane biogenesis
MAKILKWLVGLALALLALLAAMAFALQGWVDSADFRQRAALQASAALGVPVTLGAVHVTLWPLPALAVSSIEIHSTPALTLGRVEVRPQWQALMAGQLVISTLVVRQAQLPQTGIDAVLLVLQKGKQSAPVQKAPQAVAPVSLGLPVWPRRTLLEDVTWISAAGSATTLDADARLADDGLPDSATLKLTQGHLKGLRAELKRQLASPAVTADAALPQQWSLRLDVGGGKVAGQLRMQRPGSKAGDALLMQGELQTLGVEVAALTAPNRPLSGLLDAHTSFSARAATTGELVQALQTQSSFTVRDAILHGIDLVKAVKTVGLSRGGETQLQTLKGQVSTQGRTVQLSHLLATSGVVSASGEVTVSPARTLNGRIAVDFSGDSQLGSVVGVPLSVGGTLDKPEVALSRSALIGAAIGTAIMPGVGTGAGVKLGDRLGEGLNKLFGK